MRIKVNTDEVKSNVKNMAQYFNNLQAGVNKINSEFTDIGMVWEGSDSTSFMNAAEDYMTALPELQNTIDSYINAINNYLSKVESIDKEYASKIINLV